MPTPPGPKHSPGPWYPDLTGFVSTTITSLQRRYLSKEATARGQVAALRSAASREPGADPRVWALTEPPALCEIRMDEPTREERAVHAAVTLYALHQQSGASPVHVEGVSLGQAAARLIGSGEQESSAARRRFNTLATSTTFSELSRHLRSFVSQLRAEGIPLDYVALYRDLLDFQQPGGPARVRRRWARELYSRSASRQSADAAPTQDNATVPQTTSATQEACA